MNLFHNMDSRLEKLAGIKDTLIKIRDSEALQKVEADSDVAKGLAGVFSGVGDVLAQNGNGIATSNGARNAVTNSESVVNIGGNSAMDAMNRLRQENAKLQTAFAKEKATREGMESTQSIADQRTNQELQETIANLQAGGTGAGGTGTANNTANGTTPTSAAAATEGDTANVAGTDVPTGGDAIAQAMADSATNRQSVMQAQLAELSAFMEGADDDHQATLRNIQATADLQAKRVAKENDRLTQAAQVAGIVFGRGMYSPYEHEGIISEVIQDGLDRITDIENTAQEAKIEAKKAHREFRYEAFVQASEAVLALEEMKMQTIVDIGKRLQEVEAAEREKMIFDQEQQDRTSFILAAELVDATPEEIRAAALANGVDPGALMRTVADYKNEQDAIDLDRQVKEENIRASKSNTSLSWQKYMDEKAAAAAAAAGAGEDQIQLESMSDKEVERFANTYKWEPPYGMSEEEAMDIEAKYKGEPASVKEARAKERVLQLNVDRVDTTADDIKSLIDNSEDGEYEDVEKDLKDAFGLGRKDDLYTSDVFRQEVAQFVSQLGEGEIIPTKEVLMAVSESINNKNMLDASMERAMDAAVAQGVTAGFRKEEAKAALRQVPTNNPDGSLRSEAELVADMVRILKAEQDAVGLVDDKTANSTPQFRR